MLYEVITLAPLRSGSSDWRAVVRDDRGTKARLDLRELVRRQLVQLDIRPEHVTTVNLCTVCHRDLFYSYRREGRVNGTMLSGIALMSLR